MLPIQRHLFAIPRDICYLNCAYMSPLLNRVVEAGKSGLEAKAAPWRITAADFFTSNESGRRAFSTLLGATPDDIAIIPAVSYGMAVAASILPVKPGQRVLLLDEEFPSVIYAWQARARAAGAEAILIPRPTDDDWTSAVLERIDDRTAVAALPALHWTDGALVDLVRIGAALRSRGAALALDLTQSLGVMPFDLKAVQPDVVVAACYKWLLGPYSTGFMYVAPRWQQGMPLEHNWIAREGSENFGGLVRYRDAYQPGARRYDVGEPSNFALMPAAVAAMHQILEWDPARISETLGTVTREIARRASPLGFSCVDHAIRAPHYLGLRWDGGLPAGLGERLAAQQVFVSTRGAALRITPHLYNDSADLDRFEAALSSCLRPV
jgi:selenocysteine lyase/cysteine desulfurase